MPPCPVLHLIFRSGFINESSLELIDSARLAGQKALDPPVSTPSPPSNDFTGEWGWDLGCHVYMGMGFGVSCLYGTLPSEPPLALVFPRTTEGAMCFRYPQPVTFKQGPISVPCTRALDMALVLPIGLAYKLKSLIQKSFP